MYEFPYRISSGALVKGLVPLTRAFKWVALCPPSQNLGSLAGNFGCSVNERHLPRQSKFKRVPCHAGPEDCTKTHVKICIYVCTYIYIKHLTRGQNRHRNPSLNLSKCLLLFLTESQFLIRIRHFHRLLNENGRYDLSSATEIWARWRGILFVIKKISMYSLIIPLTNVRKRDEGRKVHSSTKCVFRKDTFRKIIGRPFYAKGITAPKAQKKWFLILLCPISFFGQRATGETSGTTKESEIPRRLIPRIRKVWRGLTKGGREILLNEDLDQPGDVNDPSSTTKSLKPGRRGLVVAPQIEAATGPKGQLDNEK